MTRSEMIVVIQAHMDRKTIQQRSICRPDKEWLTCKKKPCFNFEHCEYRVKPEPFECWVNVFSGEYFSFKTKQDALDAVYDEPIRTAVHMREVEE